MLPAILADSDDDGDDLVLGPDVDQPSPGPGSHDVPAVDSTHEQSTGSTQRLQNQIRSAERALLTGSPKKMALSEPVVQSSGSPTTQANKRRRTAASASEAMASPEKQVKRRKTVKTYSNKHSSSHPSHNEGSFNGLRGDGPAPATSQSARFTDHSDANDLPAGSIQAGFIDHEPNVMFKDTGSTAVDNDSSQQRMIETALSDRKRLTTSAAKLLSSDEPKSSSFPWSASEQTQCIKKAAPPEDPSASVGDALVHLAHAPDSSEEDARPSGTPNGPIEPHPDLQNNSGLQANVGERSWQDIIEAARKTEATRKEAQPQRQHSSPRVELPAPPADFPAPSSPSPVPASASVPTTTKGRKRKVQQQDTDPLNSDDIAVGLPKERYKPRPSRRRATQLDEEPVDFSVRPEKAAKMKRTKTTAVAKYTVEEEPGPKVPKKGALRGHSVSGPAEETASNAAQAASSDGIVVQHGQARVDAEKIEDAAKSSGQQLDCTPAQPDQPVQSPIKKQDDDEILVKPTPKPKASRAKRSHTTIYEDHVDFAGSQRTPSLTQQQAKRKSALTGIENEATQPTQKKRRKVVDTDDEEDELSHVTPADDRKATGDTAEQLKEEEEGPSKKRGKGRSKQTATGPKTKSAEKVLEDSDAELDDDHEQHDSQDEEPPKKRGRGRPPKAAIATKPIATQQPEQTTQPTNEDQISTATHIDRDVAASSPSKTTLKPSMQAPTPSPEKPRAVSETAALTPQQRKGSPASHSPLKSSSKVPLRVGLSKRQRIAPLLRMMKAPKRA